MIVSYATDVGKVRSDNQDSVFVHEFSENCGLFIVADGMGGYRGGKRASSVAIEEISKAVIAGFDPALNEEAIRELMHSSIRSANAIIYNEAINNRDLDGMGTTVVAALLIDKMLYTASVGDSREYVYSDGVFRQITSDHSLVANLLSRGIISAQEAKVHPQKNVITRAVGSEDDVIIDCFVTKLKEGDRILICSDGLHTMVTDDEITSAILSDSSDPATRLIACANEHGGRDNITVITVKICDEVK